MNILVFSWRDPKHPLAGGAEQVMHEHMKGWVEAGHDVTLFASHYKNGPRHEMLDGVKIVRHGRQLLGVQIAGFFWYLFGKHVKIDFVVDQFHGLPFFTPLYVRKPKLAVIQEVAREVWFLNHLPRPFNWLIGVLGYFGEPLIFLFYKWTDFMTGSESAKRDLLKIGILKKRIFVVPHGVILEIPKKLPAREKKKTIVFLGALARDKGIEDAIKVFSILNKKGDYNFWAIGKAGTGYDQFLIKMAKDLGVEVKFWGFVSQEKKFELLARSHVLVNPSVREGWGLVNIEANSVGVPVVAYNSPGLTDSVKDGISGIICRRNNPNEMADQVSKLINNELEYKKLQSGAKKWSQSFSWKRSRMMSLELINRFYEN